jgi:anti-sigma regulatory factor (Ser/Thr protein kinase)
MDVTDVRRAEQALRRQEEGIRRAYVDVLDAVTGGKLILLTEEAVAGELGQPLSEVMPISSPAQLAEARRLVVACAELRYPGQIDHADLLSPVCEALENALKHAQGGTYQVFAADGYLQVAITDAGPGIDFRMLPKATLVPGFSTAASLGMGFTIMLHLCARLLLCTRPGHTEVVLEVAAAQGPAPRS